MSPLSTTTTSSRPHAEGLGDEADPPAGPEELGFPVEAHLHPRRHVPLEGRADGLGEVEHVEADAADPRAARRRRA
jgi:hypothetical protein